MRWPPRKRRLILRIVVVRSGDRRAPYFTCNATPNRCIYNLRSGIVTRYELGAADFPYRQRHLLRCTTIRCKSGIRGLQRFLGAFQLRRQSAPPHANGLALQLQLLIAPRKRLPLPHWEFRGEPNSVRKTEALSSVGRRRIDLREGKAFSELV